MPKALLRNRKNHLRPAFFLPGALLLCLLLAACAVNRAGSDDSFKLTIAHTNDIHAAWGGQSKDGLLCYAALCEDGRGGSLRLLQAVQALRRDHENLLFLNAGDEFQGSLFFNLHKEKITAEIINALGYDAIIPGNHEFDDGPEVFARYTHELRVPLLAANISFTPDFSAPTPAAQPYIVLDRGGRSIGIVGLLTPDTARDSLPGPGVHFSDPAQTLAKSVHELEARGVDIIIALTHLGLEADRELARTVAGVDIIVGGHSHSLLANMTQTPDGPYPLVEFSPRNEPVLVVQAGFGGVYFGCLDAAFDQRGRLTAWSGDTLPLNDQLLNELDTPAPDSRLGEMLDFCAAPIEELRQTELGAINAPGLNGQPLESPNVRICRERECLSANVVSEAMLALPEINAQVALLNAGALRNSLPAGKVTAGDVLSALPFTNYLEYTDLSGEILLAALEHGAAAHGHGGFLHAAGLRYAFDPAQPPGRRVSAVKIRAANGAYLPLELAAVYRVVTVDYIAHGGDGFAMLSALPWRNTAQLLSDAVIAHLRKNSPVSPRLDGRISEIK